MAKTRTALPPHREDAGPQGPPESEVRTEPPYQPTKTVHQVRLGHVRAAVWANVGPNGTWYNVTISRLYKDDGGEWQSSESFGRVHSWIYHQKQPS